MKKKNLALIVLALFANPLPSRAVDNLRISVVGSNAVLSWPSATGETYIVEYRPTLAVETPWRMMASNHLAKAATNWTTFIHSNIVVFPPPCGTNSGSSGGGPPGFGMSMMKTENGFLTQDGELLSLEDLLPYPWNPRFQKAPENFDQNFAMTANTESVESESPCPFVTNSIGFYRVKAVQILSGLTNGAVASGVISIPVRVDENVGYLRLLVDGIDFVGEGNILPPFTNMVAFDSVDTARLTNGPHTFQIEAAWEYPQFDGLGFEKALSAKFTMNTSNELTYPEWDDNVGDINAEFRLVSAHTNVTWQIDIYNYYQYFAWVNGQTSAPAPLKVLSGTTNNGQIYSAWDLVDVNGQTRTNVATDPSFISFVTTSWETSLTAATQTKGVPPQKQSPPWPAVGLWTITYQDVVSGAYDPNGRLVDMMTGWLYSAADQDGSGNFADPVFFQEPTSGTNAQTYPIRYEYPKTPIENTNATFITSIGHDNNLLQQMLLSSASRNLYYFGHGGRSRFARFIDEPVIRNHPKQHRYRFVWLDGCDTGLGTWDRAFGIKGPGIYPLSNYQKGRTRPALFVGHTYHIPYARAPQLTVNNVTYIGTVPEHVPFFRSEFLFRWYFQNMRFVDAVSGARTSVAGLGPTNLRYSTGPKTGQTYNLGNDMVWTGYENLKFAEYNQKNALP